MIKALLEAIENVSIKKLAETSIRYVVKALTKELKQRGIKIIENPRYSADALSITIPVVKLGDQNYGIIIFEKYGDVIVEIRRQGETIKKFTLPLSITPGELVAGIKKWLVAIYKSKNIKSLYELAKEQLQQLPYDIDQISHETKNGKFRRLSIALRLELPQAEKYSSLYDAMDLLVNTSVTSDDFRKFVKLKIALDSRAQFKKTIMDVIDALSKTGQNFEIEYKDVWHDVEIKKNIVRIAAVPTNKRLNTIKVNLIKSFNNLIENKLDSYNKISRKMAKLKTFVIESIF